MQIILAVEVSMEGGSKISNVTDKGCDGFPPLAGFRRIHCHCQAIRSDGLETQSSPAAPTLRFCGTTAGRLIRSFFIL
jgi:hypothetical protein